MMKEFQDIKSLPPDESSGYSKPCDHKYVHLGQKRVYIDDTKKMTKLVDIFYCEKCLEYQYKDR